MSDTSARFHFALARISALQLLRATGLDRSRASVVDSLADILVRYLHLLGQESQKVAESAGRHACELEDVRSALEAVGAIALTTRENIREEDGVLQFITWCMSDEAVNIRRIAGEGHDEMDQDVSADWLNQLVEKQIKVTGEDKFIESMLRPIDCSRMMVNQNAAKISRNHGKTIPAIEGLAEEARRSAPEVVLLHDIACGTKHYDK